MNTAGIAGIVSGAAIVVAAVVGAIFVRKSRKTSISVNVADLFTQLASLNEKVGRLEGENVVLKSTLETLAAKNQHLIDRVKALEAEADRIEKVRKENITLKTSVTKLRRRVKRLEDCLRDNGLEPPADPDLNGDEP